jgi:hypothetical protein
VKVPLLKLKPGYDELLAELDASYRRVMDSGRYILGKELERSSKSSRPTAGSPAALASAVEDKFGVQFTEEEIARLGSLVSFAEHLENFYAA